MQFRDVGIRWLGGSSFRIVVGELVFFINPMHDKGEKADCVLISTISPVEVDLQLAGSMLKPSGKIVIQSDFAKALKFVNPEQLLILAPGASHECCDVEIEMTRVDNPAEKQNGFLIKTKQTTVYYSGDTHFTPEMNLIECDVALLPINGKNSMDFDEAASAVNVLVPEVVIPYNYTQKDFEKAQRFANIAKEITEVELIEPEDDD